ncbi:transthyretin-like family domain-containing protein [Ditylenchus destructor]|uniref:Transthyretin-like family domain-containing protein n=1 Tax=Ditylenchus destructor TaxID=166010 RepID=A0AAD4MQR6_9BILA|nr:transthyretin-like family domain-containing protein [Ditylenchus destructor]
MRFLFVLSAIAWLVMTTDAELLISVHGIVQCAYNLGQEGQSEVQLWDHNYVAPDTHIETVYADVNGFFHVQGKVSSINIVDPYLKFLYRCGGHQQFEQKIQVSGHNSDFSDVDMGKIILLEE